MRGLLTSADLPRTRIERLLSSARAHAAGRQAQHPDAARRRSRSSRIRCARRLGFDVAAARLRARTTTVHGAKQTAAMAIPSRWRTPSAALRRGATCCACAIPTPARARGRGSDRYADHQLRQRRATSTRRRRSSTCSRCYELFRPIDGLRVALVGDLYGDADCALARDGAVAVRRHATCAVSRRSDLSCRVSSRSRYANRGFASTSLTRSRSTGSTSSMSRAFPLRRASGCSRASSRATFA